MLIRSPFSLMAALASVTVLLADVSMLQAQRSDTIVKLARAPRYAGVAALIPDLKIGVLEGDEAYLFGGPSEILLQRDGSLVVLDWSGDGMATAVLRRYDGTGRFLRKVGGRGSGPGEYLSPTGLAELPDGRLLLGDSRNGRINVYSASGESVGAWHARAYGAVIRGAEWLKVGPNGNAYLRFTLPRNPNAGSPVAIVRFRADGTVADTLMPPELPSNVAPRLTATGAGGRGSFSRSVPYWPRSLWTLNPQGYFVTAVNGRYAIDVRQANQVVSIRRDVAPVPISAEERKEQRDFVGDWLRFYGTFSGTVPDVPRTKPFFKFITTFHDGRIWASLSTPSERFEPPPHLVGGRTLPAVRWREPTLFDVFESDGTYVGQVAVPYDVVFVGARGDVAWGWTRAELDVPIVVRYRISWRR